MKKWCGVVGYPIAHSLSPIIHQAAYKELGLDWDYRICEVMDLDELLSTLDPDCSGLAITMPYKQTIASYLDAIDPLAGATGVVNTVVFAGAVATGFNTDVFGIVKSVQEVAPNRIFKQAVILGSRATACSALAALGELGSPQITVIARTLGGPGTTAVVKPRLGLDYQGIPWRNESQVLAALNQADLVISTVPRGVPDNLAAQIVPRPDAVLLDVVYAPWPSALVQCFTEAGAQIVPGWSMLLHQATQQVRLQTGKPAPLQAMRQALLAAI